MEQVRETIAHQSYSHRPQLPAHTYNMLASRASSYLGSSGSTHTAHKACPSGMEELVPTLPQKPLWCTRNVVVVPTVCTCTQHVYQKLSLCMHVPHP